MRLKHFLSVFLTLLTLSVGQMWGDQVSFAWSGTQDATTKAITWTSANICTMVQEQNGAQTAPNSSYISAPRWYSGNKITITAGSSVSTFTSIVITATSNSYATTLANSTYTRTGGTGSVSAAASGTAVTITCTGTVTAFTIVMGGQSRLSSSTTPTINYTAAGTPEPTLSLSPTSVSVDATDVAQQTIALTASNFSPAVTTVTTGLYSNEGCTSAVTSGAWVKDITVNNAKTQVTFNVDDNTGAARQVWMKITASNGTKSADAILPISQAKYTAPTGTFNKFTGATLTEGYYVICDGTDAMKNAIKSSRLDYASVTVTNNKITNPDASLVWKFEALTGDDAGYWTFYNEDAEKYAAFTSSNGNATLLDEVTNYAKFNHVSNSSYEFQNKGRTDKNLRKNGTYGFASYSTQTGSTLTLYKKALPSHAVTFSAAPTGGAVAVSVGGSAISSGDQVGEGATVTITPTASTYYQIASVTKGGQAITPVQGVYSFTMPSSDVAVAATFELIPVTAVTLNKSQLELVEGATETLSVSSVTPNTARSTVTWSSTNTNVATVTSAGVVTAKAAGSATIKATSTVTTSVFGSCALTVSAPSGNPITISQTTGGTVTANIVDLSDVLAGTSVTLTATPSDGYSFNSWTVIDGNADDITPTATTATTFTFSMPNSAVEAEASFTHEVAVLKLHDADGESTYDSGNTHYWKESVTLPDNAAACSKTFMGWSADADRSTAPEIAKGASYTIPNKGTNHLYAVYAATEDEDVTITPSAVSDGDDPHTITIDQTGYTLSANKNNGSSAPTWNSTASDVRIYAKGDITLASSTKTMKSIVFNLSAQGLKRLAPITASEGTIETQTSGDETVTWTGSATSVTFTVGDNADYGSDGSSKAGQLDFSTIDVVVAGTPSSYSTTCAPQVAAPTFSVDAGMYTEGQTIHISAVEGATIYYTTDGNDPITSSDVFDEDIVLSARAITTVKAIAVKAGYENSNVASAVYNINLPFTVAEAIAEIPTPGDQRAKTYIDGIVCTAATSISSGAMTYYISGDGTETSRIRIYNGKGLDNADFSATSDLKVGDKVRVYGLLNNYQGSYDVDNSYLTSLEVATLSTVAISGEAAKTAYSAEDNTFSYAGLIATATYSTGYVKDVTAEATWKANNTASYTVTEAGDINVTATFGGQTSTAKVVTVTYSSKTVESISLSYSSITTYVGHNLLKPIVTAHYVEDIADEDVTDLATFDDATYNKNTANTYTIGVSYQGQNASYNITVKAIANDQATAYTATEINDIIVNAYKSTSESGYDVYVRGIVVNDPNNSGTYYISEDGTATNQFTIWQGKYFSSSESAAGNVKADDEVIVKGKIQYYNSTTPELKSSTVVYQLRDPEFAIANIEAEDEFEAGFSEDMTVVPTKNSGDVAFTLSSGNTSAVTIVNNKLHAVAEGDAVITASRAATVNTGSINYKAKETTFSVHVIAARTRYAVTFNNGGATGGSAPETIANQLEGAEVSLPECTWSWAQHGFTGWTVKETVSGDPVSVSAGKFTMPAAAVTITANWEEIITTHIIFSVNGNTDVIAAVDVPREQEYTLSQIPGTVSGYEFFGWAESEENEDVETPLTTIDSYTPAANEGSKTLYAAFTRTETGANKTDVITAADLAATSNSYVEFSNVTKVSNAKYAGKTAKNGTNIQINDANGQCIISTTSGGLVKNVSITWGSSSNTLDVYASNTAYTAIGDLWDNSKKGTKVTSFTASGSYNFTNDYAYVGIRSSKNAIQLASVSITWQPSTTYYTTAPAQVYDVTYNLGSNPAGAWKENEGCEDAKVKGGQTFSICEDEPVREHHKFNGWTVGGNAVSGTITINGNTTITADWIAKTESNVTYNAGTGTGSDVVVSNVEEGTEVTLKAIGSGEGQVNFTKSGYDFVGWLINGVLRKAGETFEMPAEAVTLTAQWKKQNVEKMTLITSVEQLVSGTKVILACKDPVSNNVTKPSVLAGDLGSNKYLAHVQNDITFSGNEISYTNDSVLVLTAEQVEGGWKLQKDATHYLKETSVKNLIWTTSSEATIWAITFSNGNANVISPLGALKYNASSPRFTTYESGQNNIQLYGKATVVSSTTSISDLGYVDGDVIVLGTNVTLTVDQDIAPVTMIVPAGDTVKVNDNKTVDANTIIVERGGMLDIQTNGTVKTDETFVIYTTIGKGTGSSSGSGNAPGSSSQIKNANKIDATGDVFIEIELTPDAAASEGWYAFSVPFPVDALNGVYFGDTKLTNEVGYAIMSYHGDIRAQGQYAWKKYRDIMQPGVLYIITVGDTDYKTLRFKKHGNEAFNVDPTVGVKSYPVEPGIDATNKGWNGIGNPNMRISYLPQTTNVAYMQFLDHDNNRFQVRQRGNVNVVVGSAFFVQYSGSSDATIEITPGLQDGANGYLAPKRERNAVEETIYEVQLTNLATEEVEDNIYLTAREEATNTYEVGRDLAKMSMGAAKCAQMYVPAYGTQLCAADFPLVNDKAEYPLTITAPANGQYRIEMADQDNADLYLTLNGAIIWNLSMGAYEFDLTQGTTEGYGLLLKANAPAIATGVDEVNAEANVQKVVINDNVFILRNGQMFDVTGKAVK